MSAFKHSDRKLRSNTGERVALVTIHHGDRLNNDDRAPFWNGSSAARALLIHAANELGDQNTGPAYFNRLRQIFDNTTLTGEGLRRVLNARSEASAAALERSDLVLDSERELNLINDIAQAHKELGAKLMPELQAAGLPAEQILPTIEHITRRALRSATAVRTGEEIRVEQPNRVADASTNLVARLGRIDGNDHSSDQAVVDGIVAAARSGEGMDEARAALQAKLETETAVVVGRSVPEGMTAAEVDANGIANRFARLVVTDREGAANEEEINPNAWQNDLLARLEAAPGSNGEENANLVVRFASSIYELESLLPTRVERAFDEQLYDIDAAIDPTEFARARDRIGGALGEALTADDAAELDARANISVYDAMTAEERLEAATTIAMTPAERVELGMKVIGSTPPIIDLPAVELGQGRFDVAMATAEEAVVMEALIKWAGTHRQFPGTDESREELMGLMRDNSTSGKLGVDTFGLAVSNSPALISHAKSLIAQHTAEYPEDRILVFADIPSVGEELMAFRADQLKALGRDHQVTTGVDDATREFGGWTVPGNQDRILGQGKFDTDIFVAASDNVMTLAVPSQLDATGIGRANDRLAATRAALRSAEKAVKDANEKLAETFDPKLVAQVRAHDNFSRLHDDKFKDAIVRITSGERGVGSNDENLKDAVSVMIASGAKPQANAVLRADALLKTAYATENTARKHLEALERQNSTTVYNRATRGEILMAEVIDGARRRDKLVHAFTTLPKSLDAKTADAGQRRRNAYVKTEHGPLLDQSVYVAQAEAGKLLSGKPYEDRQVEDVLAGGIDARYDQSRNLNTVAVLGSNFFNRKTKEIEDRENPGQMRRVSVMEPKLDEAGKKMFHQSGKFKGRPVTQPVLDNRGLEELVGRARGMSKSTTFVIEAQNPEAKIPNPVVDAMVKFASDTKREIVHAVAWRVTDSSTVISEGRRVTISDRRTDVDYGVVLTKAGEKDKETMVSRSRQLTPQDMRGKVLSIDGGGQMTRATWEAIREYRAAQNVTQRPLTPEVASGIAQHLINNGMTHLKMPTTPRNQQSQAVKQEGLSVVAKTGLIGTDFGTDYASANNLMNLARLGKVGAVIGQDGQSVRIADAIAHAEPMAPSIAGVTRQSLEKAGVFHLQTAGDDAQLMLSSFKGINPTTALALASTYERTGDIMEAAAAGQLAVRVTPEVAHQLSRPKAWQEAAERTLDIKDNLTMSQMSGFTAGSSQYPQNILEAARAVAQERADRLAGNSKATDGLSIQHVPTGPIYTKGDVDMNQSTLAMIIGGDARPSEADIDAAKRIASEANEKDMAVSVHMSGEASARILTELAKMDENERPRLLVIGDGHPESYVRPAEAQAIKLVTALDNGGYATSTPPVVDVDRETKTVEIEGKEQEVPAFVADRRLALDLQAHQADAVVVVKSTGEDIELLGLRTAIAAGKPIAAVGPVVTEDAGLSDIRFRGTEYSANRRLLEGGDSVSVMLDNRVLAFVPNFVPFQPEVRYVPFDGSTEGVQNPKDRNRGQDDDNARGAIESGERIRTTISWGDKARSVEDGRGVGAFIEEVRAGEVASIVATPAQIAQRDLSNDARFLDMASRSGVSAEVERVFSDIQTESNELAMAEMQMMAAKMQGQGR